MVMMVVVIIDEIDGLNGIVTIELYGILWIKRRVMER